MNKHLETAGKVERMLAEESVLVAQSTVDLVGRCRMAENALAAAQAETVELESDYADQVLRAMSAERERDAALAQVALLTDPGKPNGPCTTSLSKLLNQVIHGDFAGDNPEDLSLALRARQEYAELEKQEPLSWEMRTRMYGRAWTSWSECANRTLKDPMAVVNGPMYMEFRPLFAAAGASPLPSQVVELSDEEIIKAANIGAVYTERAGWVERRPEEYRQELQRSFLRGAHWAFNRASNAKGTT